MLRKRENREKMIRTKENRMKKKRTGYSILLFVSSTTSSLVTHIMNSFLLSNDSIKTSWTIFSFACRTANSKWEHFFWNRDVIQQSTFYHSVLWSTDFWQNHLIYSFHKYLLAATKYWDFFSSVLKQIDLINIVFWKVIRVMEK